ncbi:MAG: IPT/TIG domain-containing protein [Nitrospirae bacterium]|nr:IPT/TIG domain-containing protein [Nitrospirota bacterium]
MIANLNGFKKISAKILLSVLALFLPVAAQAGTWTWIGPDGGHVHQAAVSPRFSQDKTVFLATDNEGVLKSTDGGKNWSAVNTGLDSLRVNSVAVTPDFSSNQTAYVGTAHGVFKSVNGGRSWKEMSNGITVRNIESLVISPSFSSDSTLLAGTNGGGIFKSTDGGNTWTLINSGLTNLYVNGVTISPAYSSDGILYAATNAGVFKSLDRGATWKAFNTGITSLSVTAIAISPGFSTDQTVFVGTLIGGVFKTTTGGNSTTTWTAASTGLGSPAVSTLSISPNFSTDNTLLAGTSNGGIFKSTDRGATWVSADATLANHIILSLNLSSDFSNDQTFFAGTDGHGVYKSDDGGNNSHDSNDGMRNPHVSALGVSPDFSADSTVFIGLKEKGIYKTVNGGSTWTQLNTGLSGKSPVALAVSPNYAADSTIFAGYHGRPGIYKSVDGGNSWSQVNSGIASLNVQTLKISPNYKNDRTLFAGMRTLGGVYKTTDGGATWIASATGITKPNIDTFAISPNFASDQTLFAGTAEGGVFKSVNGGSSWTAVNSGITDLSISELVISPNYSSDSTLYVGTASAGVFKTVNGGSTWVSARNGLGNKSVTSLSISPAYAAKPALFAGTSGNGVFQTLDGGNNWILVNNGLGNLDITRLGVSPGYPCDGTLFAGTDGSSGWRYSDTEAVDVCYPAPPPPQQTPIIRSISPTSGSVSTEITITGSYFGATRGSSTVLFNGAPAGSIVSWSDAQILATVPTGATTGPLTVTVNGLTSNGVTFTVTAPPPPASPVISDIAPLSGVIDTQVTITGSNFGSSKGTSSVLFNGTPAGTIVSWSGSQIVAAVPSAATTGPLVVIVNGVSSNGVTFTVTPPSPPPVISPVISAISPSSGIVTTPVTITGSDFGATQGSSAVLFNGAPAGSIVSWSDTQIVATVPSGATTGPLTVTVNGLTSNGVTFTVTAPPPAASPAISALSPVAGYVNTQVTITGSYFGFSQGTSAVLFNGLPADTIVSWSDTQIIATVPSGATTGQVVVMVNGTSSNGVVFTVSTVTGSVSPVITGISPASAYSGLQVTITGYGFGATQGTSTVTFEGVVATVVSWSDTQIVVIYPTIGASGVPVVTVGGVWSTSTAPFTGYAPSDSPDLTVYSLTTTLGGVYAFAGDTERNTGIQAAVPFNVSFYFSPTLLVNPSVAHLIGVRKVNGLAGGGATNALASKFTVPPTMPIGNYYLCAISDSDNQVSETSEINNSRCTTALYAVNPYVKSYTVTGTLAGMTIKTSDSQQNTGNQPAGPFMVSHFLAKTTTPNASTDMLIGTRNIASLAGGLAVNLASLTLGIPPTMAIGNYYFCTMPDLAHAVAQLSYASNFKCTTTTYAVTPDLKGYAVSATIAGMTLKISDTQQNTGTQPAGAFRVAYYLALTTTVNTSTDFLIGTRDLAGLAGGSAIDTASATLAIPPTMPIGNYYFCAISDSLNQVGELAETNNTKCTAAKIAISPDLKTYLISGTLSGMNIVVGDTQQNTGDQPAGAFRVAYYLTSTTIPSTLSDTLIGTRDLAGLDGGSATNSATSTLAIPPAMPIGSYYLCAISDSLNQVAELVETGNYKCTTTKYAVSPDLKTYTITDILSGTNIIATDTQQNIGTQPAGAFTVTFYLSLDKLVGTGDILLGTRSISSLAGGSASNSASTTFAIPSGTPAGSYYLIGVSDSGNTVLELVETNNTLSTTGVLAIPAIP